jgi:hypothetical protein
MTPFRRRPDVFHRARHLACTAIATALFLATLPLAAQAQPFGWLLPMGGESWSTDHVHTVRWNGGPAMPVNLYLVNVPMNTVEQTIALGETNDGEYVFRINSTVPPGTYTIYIEDVVPQSWAYSPQFHIQPTPPCVSPCTQGAFGSPLLVCGQTQAEAESLAVALAQSHIQCGMAGNVVPGSVSIETTLVNVGPYNCPPGYGGAYAVEVSAVWCCCHEPTGIEGRTWSGIKALYRDDERR